ncbi:hypothetical protein [Micromonospora sp. NPDC000442]|uniref:hypothetical protein n=1 Tax=Micromonospora sp. NPDC000442 TaxID=3364217 RepID=UPI0036BB05CE
MTANWLGHLTGLRTRPADSVRSFTFSAELRSCHPHIAFDAIFQMQWQGDGHDAYWRVRQDVTRWADQVTAKYCVTQVGNAENEINSGVAYNANVQLTVSRQARAAAEGILDVHRQTALERLKQQAELERVRFMRETVYSQPDVARSYWLYHHPDRPEELLTIKFEEIAEKFGDAAESRSLGVAKLIDEFLGQLGESERRYLLGQVGQVFSSYNRTDLAERLEIS